MGDDFGIHYSNQSDTDAEERHIDCEANQEGSFQRFCDVLGQPNEKLFPLEGNTLKVGEFYHVGLNKS